MSSAHENHDRFYIGLWVVLLVALFVSLGIGAVSGSTAAVTVIFVIAAIKAFLVLAYFMHLTLEPWHLRLVIAGALTATACFLVGVFPDVAMTGTHIDYEARAAALAALPPPAVVELLPGDAARGEKVYSTYCVGCHQADGKGKGGTLAANFVDDRERMAKPDAELLTAIAEGKKGQIGTMPAWKAALSEQQRIDALAYVRETFAGQP